MTITYLACPYSAGKADNRLARFNAVTTVAARLVEQKRIIFSPITMTHPIDLVMAADGETLGSDFWVAFDEAFMAVCSDFMILRLPGWDSSSGVRRETEFFAKRGLNPKYLDPQDFGVSPDDPSYAAAFA